MGLEPKTADSKRISFVDLRFRLGLGRAPRCPIAAAQLGYLGSMDPHDDARGSEEQLPRGDFQDFGEAASRAVDEMEAASYEGARRIPTGFQGLDQLNLIRTHTVTAICGVTGVGSSTLALNMADFAASAGVETLVLSWESTTSDLFVRLSAARGRIYTQNLTTGYMGEESWQKFADTMAEHSADPIYLGDGPESMKALLEVLTRWASNHAKDRGLIVLDGLPSAARLSDADQGLWENHSRLSAEIKALSMRFPVAVLYTTPVVREVITRGQKRPSLGDIAYSPAYATDADAVIGIYRDDYWDRESPRAGEADLVVLKSRHTPTDVFTVAFQGHYSRFVDIRVQPV